MKKRPIIFSSEMIRAILEGRKSITRRIVKKKIIAPRFNPEIDMWQSKYPKAKNFKCPYGKVGDRLWVRETFAIECNQGYQDVYVKPENPLGPIRVYKGDGDESDYFECPRYKASEPNTLLGDEEDGMKWQPSIHMPRWTSRITLEITDIRVERLREMREGDVIAEGIKSAPQIRTLEEVKKLWLDWKTLWNSLAKKGFKWEDNPWVWVISFRKL